MSSQACWAVWRSPSRDTRWRGLRAGEIPSFARSFPGTTSMRKWRIEDSVELYNTRGWGIGYFGINEKGHATVSPLRERGPAIDLKDVMDELALRDTNAPVLLRFPD